MTFNPLTIVAVTTIVFSLSACNKSTHWSKPGVSNAQMLQELSQCRHWAEKEIEKEYGLEQATTRHQPSSSDADYRAQMSRFSALKRRDRLTESCMQQSGYQKVKAQ